MVSGEARGGLYEQSNRKKEEVHEVAAADGWVGANVPVTHRPPLAVGHRRLAFWDGCCPGPVRSVDLMIGRVCVGG